MKQNDKHILLLLRNLWVISERKMEGPTIVVLHIYSALAFQYNCLNLVKILLNGNIDQGLLIRPYPQVA